MRFGACLLAGLALVGSIDLSHPEGGSEVEPTPFEVVLGRLASGGSVGTNATNASVTLAGTLLSTTTGAWWLNNTNATGAYVVRVEAYETSGLANLAGLVVGVNNGTATPQVVASLGSLTQASGAWVTLPPGSSSTVYVTRSVVLPGSPSAVRMTLTVADDASASAFVVLRASLEVR